MSVADLGRPRVALVLGSGGTRGIAHIGVLKVLRQERIPIDLVVGCSAGSIIGALFCSGIAQDKLQQIGVTCGRKDVFDYVLSKNGVIDGSKVESFIVKHAGRRRFAQLETPFAVICTDVEAGEEIVIARGDVARAVRASCSFPGLMVPMRVNGKLLVDGGVLDKLPVTIARKLGADVVIAVNVTAKTQGVQISNAVELIIQTINLMGNRMADTEARLADVLITPDVGQQWMLDFKDAEKCIDAGVEAAKKAMPNIRALLSQRQGKQEQDPQ